MCKNTEASPERQDLVPAWQRSFEALLDICGYNEFRAAGLWPATGPSNGLLLLLFSCSVMSDSL